MNPSPRDDGADWLLHHAAWIQSLARSLVGDPAVAEVLVQDAWVAALEKRPRADRPLEPWFRTVLSNLVRKSARRRIHRADRESRVEPPEDSPDPEKLCEQLESERLLTEELSRLEEPFRSTLILRYYRGLEPTEIARRQGIPGGTVRWRVKRGLELLRERLDRRSGGDGSSWALLLLPLARPQGAAAYVAGSAVAATGALVMNTALKVGAVLVAALIAYIGLNAGGILPGPFSPVDFEGQPVDVAFRPIASDAGLGAPRDSVSDERRAHVGPAVREAAAGTAPPPTSGIIEAVIVDDAGRALGGAHFQEVTESGVGPGVRSSSSGRVRLELDAGEGEHRVRVEAYREGYTSRTEEVRLQAGRTVSLGTIALVPGGVISGSVVDDAGRPVADAFVTHVEGTQSGVELNIARFVPSVTTATALSLSVPRATTDGAGAFTLGGLPVGFSHSGSRRTAGSPPTRAAVEVREGQETYGVEIEIRPVGDADHVHGIVLDPAGEPVPHATLWVTHRSKKGGVTIVGDELTAGDDGTFDLPVFDDARVWVTARDPLGRYGSASAEDVPTGGGPLVLQLTELATTNLVVAGGEGDPLERFAFTVLSPDETLTHADHETGERAGGVAPLNVPDSEFVVRVKAPLHRTEVFGPYDPERVGDSIEVRLETIRGLSGRTFGGESPLAGARVTLLAVVAKDEWLGTSGFRCRVDPIPADETTSDEEGRFVLTANAEGDYHVVAEKDGLALAELGPIRLGPDVGAAPVELHLGVGGSIGGRVIVGASEDPTGIIVGVHRGIGRPQTVRVGPDGAYHFTGLSPGLWIVEVRDAEVFADRRSITTRPRFGGSFEEEVEWSCEVFEGETTWHDLYQTDPLAYRIAGSLKVEGRLPHAWLAYLLPEDANPLDLDRYRGTPLDAKGAFEVGVPEPGRYTLVIKSTLEEQEEQFFLDEVDLDDDVTPWSVELATGSLVVEGLATIEPGPDDIPPFVYRWEGPGDLQYLSVILPGTDGTCRLNAVPVGTGQLVRPTAQSMDPLDWEVAGEVAISEGKEARITAR